MSDAAAWFQKALDCHRRGEWGAAGGFYRAALDADPQRAPAYCNLGMVHSAQEQHEVALSLARISAALDPTNAIYRNNIGKVLWSMRRYGEARVELEAALALDPALPAAHHNMGSTWFAEGYPGAALDAYDKALQIEPGRSDTQWDRAWALLACGDFERGLAAYELRWSRIPKAAIWDSGIAEWQGEDLTGKHIVVHHEQGYGDTLNFVRFAMMLKQRYPGMRVTFGAPPALYGLMHAQRCFDAISLHDLQTDWHQISAALHPIDYHSPVISVMRWLPDWTISGKPYLSAPPPMACVRDPARFAVGVVWSGAVTGMPGSRFKPIDPTYLAPLAEIHGVALYGLQKHDGLDELHDSGMASLIRDCSGRIKDFHDLAASMAAMDLIVSVDTGPLHLAGALGLPCIGMIPYERCWRWPRGDATETPWYSSMRVVSQRAPGDWAGVIERVRERIIGQIHDVQRGVGGDQSR